MLQKASISTLAVPHNDKISFSYSANVKHTWNSMQPVALKTRLPFDLMCFVSTQGKSRYSSTLQSSGLEVVFSY